MKIRHTIARLYSPLLIHSQVILLDQTLFKRLYSGDVHPQNQQVNVMRAFVGND